MERQGLPIRGYQVPGLSLSFGALVPLKGSPQEPFYEMANILLMPEVQIQLALGLGTMCALDMSKADVPQEIKNMPGYDPTGELKGWTIPDPVYWTDNADQWQRQYQRLMARG